MGSTVFNGCLRKYRKSILQLRTSLSGRLRDLQHILAVIYETRSNLLLLYPGGLSEWSYVDYDDQVEYDDFAEPRKITRIRPKFPLNFFRSI